MTTQARGMPDMELSESTKDDIQKEQEEAKPVKEDEMFQRPSMEIKPVEDIKENKLIEEESLTRVPVLKPKVIKPKKKLTDKQLDALRKGREKSVITRKANAEKRKKEKELIKNPQVEASKPIQIPQPTPQTQTFQPQTIDYDKIINGVASRYDSMMKNREDREHRVANDINQFEERVRAEERERVINEIDILQKEELKSNQHKVAHATLSRTTPPASQNPYLYAMDMGARQRFKRY